MMKTSNGVKKIISLILITLSLLSLVGCDALRESCDHELVESKTLAGIAPTCTDSGLTEGQQCRICGETLLAREEILPLGHIFEYEDDGSVENRTNKAHCTREGCGFEKIATDEERLIDEWRSASGIYYGDIKIAAKLFIKDVALSSTPYLIINISNDNIYLFKRQQQYEAQFVDNYACSFDIVLFGNGEKIINGEKVSDIVEKIEECEGGYLLLQTPPKLASAQAHKILVKKIGDYYYFIYISKYTERIHHIIYTDFKDGFE